MNTKVKKKYEIRNDQRNNELKEQRANGSIKSLDNQKVNDYDKIQSSIKKLPLEPRQ